jgi:hypothetical protein
MAAATASLTISLTTVIPYIFFAKQANKRDRYITGEMGGGHVISEKYGKLKVPWMPVRPGCKMLKFISMQPALAT